MTRLTLRFALTGLLLVASAPVGCAVPHDEVVGSVTFVESWPQHTDLDLPELPDASTVWPATLAAAQHRIELAGFYFSRKGDGEDAYGPATAPDLLLPVLDALEAAAERGVTVHLLADAKFARNYPAVPAWTAALPGAESRVIDLAGAWDGGGVLHAKYFIVDEDQLFVGSQNFDWRALGQIHELGVLVRHPVLTTELRRIYTHDWALASESPADASEDVTAADVALAALPAVPLVTVHGDTLRASLAASPGRALPAGIPWDLPLLVEMIDTARDSVHVQLLSYGVTDREKRLFDDLDRALRRAAVRGAQVRLLVSDWALGRYGLPWLQSLAAVPGLQVRFTRIPAHPDGFIPYARVEHAKYATVDGHWLWLGTSNWARDYFHASRNVSLFFQGAGATRDPDRFFHLSWHGPYAEILQPGGAYEPPRRH